MPVGKKVRILTTAADVIHAWWVPAFGAKQDAIPGFIRDLWFRAEQDRHLPQPVRRAVRQGARLHADRGARGVAPEDYSKWVGEQKKLMAAAADDPNKTCDAGRADQRAARRSTPQNCVACHQATGQGMPAVKAPPLDGSKLVTGAEAQPIDTVLQRPARTPRWRRSASSCTTPRSPR